MFITLGGVDGSGKTTQASRLVEALGEGTVRIREPGGTEAAEQIRNLLADPEIPLDPVAELLLFCAARADLISRVIKPAIEAEATTSSVTASPIRRSPTRAVPGTGTSRVRAASPWDRHRRVVPDLTLLLRVVRPRSGPGRERRPLRGRRVRFQEVVAATYEEIDGQRAGAGRGRRCHRGRPTRSTPGSWKWSTRLAT